MPPDLLRGQRAHVGDLWVALLAQRYTCLLRLIEFAELFATFEENPCQTSSVGQVVPPGLLLLLLVVVVVVVVLCVIVIIIIIIIIIITIIIIIITSMFMFIIIIIFIILIIMLSPETFILAIFYPPLK